MNLLEHYIKEIHEEEILVFEGKTYVKADITVNCHGRVERKKDIFAVSEWEEAKKRGYYMA